MYIHIYACNNRQYLWILNLISKENYRQINSIALYIEKINLKKKNYIKKII